MDTKITYLLGAGASYNAIPIVKELNSAFNIIASKVQETNFTVGTNADKNDFEKAKEDFIKLLKEAAQKGEAFGSIDTYARKLFLKDDSHLAKIKAAITLFLVTWQEMGNKQELASKLGREKIFTHIDNRYIGLLSNYLQKGTAISSLLLPQNVKFISWNYDIQLERAINEFVEYGDIEHIFKDFNVFPSQKEFSEEQIPDIVHLNGIAGIYRTKEGIKNIFDRGKTPATHMEVFNRLMFFITSVSRNQIHNHEHFTYAWENDDVSKKALKYSIDIFKETELLVIIGYSFPTFNDTIDKQLMNAFLHGKGRMIYYQDPKASKETLMNRFGIQENRIRIYTDKESMNQFILPLDKISDDLPIKFV